MASRFNVDAFTADCKLASKLYYKCETSTNDIRELSCEVDGLSIVLEEIKSFWHKHDLTGDQKASLAGEASNYHSIFKDVSALLDEGQDVKAVKTNKHRNRVIFQLRNWMINQAMDLATLNFQFTSTMPADTGEKQRAQLLKALNTIHRENFFGQRRTTALSQVMYNDVDEDERQCIWDRIAAEIETEQVDRNVINNNWPFIENWILRVMAEIDDESDEGVQVHEIGHAGDSDTSERQNVTVSIEYGQPARTATWANSLPAPVPVLTEPQPDSNAVVIDSTQSTNTLRLEQSPNNLHPDPTHDRHHVRRVPSTSSHRSQASNWRPSTGPNPAYVEALLVKLLTADATTRQNSRDPDLTAKRVFAALDLRDRGYLSYPIVELRCWNSLRNIEPNFDRKIIMRLIQAADVDEDNMISLREFIALVNSLITTVGGFRETIFMESVDADSRRGTVLIDSYLSANKENPLRWNWAPLDGSWVFKRDDRVLLTSRIAPRAGPNTFVNMELIARDLCSNTLDSRFDTWFKEPEDMSTFDEIKNPVYAVLDIAAKFSGFNRQDFRDLDKYEEIIGLILQCQQDDNPRTHPILILQRWKDECYRLLQLLVGFVIIVDQDLVAQYHNRPPSLHDWRTLRMKDRADYIERRAGFLVEMQSQLDEARKWANMHPDVANEAIAAIERTVDLQRSQISLEREEIDHGVPVEFGIMNLICRPRLIIMGTVQCSATLSDVSAAKPKIIRSITDKHDHSNASWNESFECDVFVNREYRIDITLSRAAMGRPLGVAGVKLYANFTVTEADLNSTEKSYKALDLIGFGRVSKATVVVTIAPKRVMSIQPRPEFQSFSSFRDLVRAIKSRPLPPPWQMRTTIDGKTYFESSVIDVPKLDSIRPFHAYPSRNPFLPITPPATAREVITRTAACHVS